MKKCTITLLSDAEGRQTCSGEIEILDNGFDLCYNYGNDSCFLSVKGSSAVYTRRGAVNIDATYKRGYRTAFIVYSVGMRGVCPLDCVKLEKRLSPSGAELRLEYVLGEPTLSDELKMIKFFERSSKGVEDGVRLSDILKSSKSSSHIHEAAQKLEDNLGDVYRLNVSVTVP